MSVSGDSLSSMDEVSCEEIFKQSAQLFEKLKEDATALRETLKQFQKKYVDLTLSERLFDPRPHAVPWFESRGLKTPCGLDEFMEGFASGLAADCRICHSTRTVILLAEEGALFGLQEGKYKWLEILMRLPAVFQ